MKKRIGVAALAFGLSVSASANASLIQMDVSSLIAGTGPTDLFQGFTFAEFSPTSTYYDDDGTPGISTGDTVHDDGMASITALNPLAFGDNFGGFGTAWGIDVTWHLEGKAVMAGSDYLGNFTSGLVTYTLTDGVSTWDILNIDVTGSSLGTPGSGSVGIEIFGDVSFAWDDIFFDQYGNDLNDLINDPMGPLVIGMAVSDIDDLDNAPEYLGTSGEDDVFTRDTTLPSVDMRINIPEPGMLALLSFGILGFSLYRRNN